jgi:geranylgeranyl pyrophosphate synthase
MVMEKYPEDNPIIKLFENKDRQVEIDRAIEIVKNSTIVDECYEIAEDYRRKACHDIIKLPECETRTCLDELAHYMITRKK